MAAGREVIGYIRHAGETLDRKRFQQCPGPRSLLVGPVGRGLFHGERPHRDGPNWADWPYFVEFAARNITDVSFLSGELSNVLPTQG